MPRAEREPSAARGYGLVAIAAFCWAGGGLIAKWLFTAPGTDTVAWIFQPLGIEIDPVLLSASRAMLSAVITFALLVLWRRELLVVRVRNLPFLAAFGVFGLALVHLAYFKTIATTDVATAILLEYLAPVVVLVVSVAFLGERLTATLPAAVVLSVGGCALMVGAIGGDGFHVSSGGLAWGLGSAVLFAGYMLMGRYAAGRFAPWTMLFYGLAAASIFWLMVLGGPSPVLALLSDGRAFLAVLALSVVSTVVPFAAFLAALRDIETTKASVTSTLEPVIAGCVAWFAFGEHLTPLQLLGGGCVVAAIVVSQVRTHVPPEMPVVREGPG